MVDLLNTDLAHTFAESLKLAEDVHFGEVEWSFVTLLNIALGFMEGALVLLVKVSTLLHATDDHLRGVVPHARHPVLGDIRLTRLHHLVRYLEQQ